MNEITNQALNSPKQILFCFLFFSRLFFVQLTPLNSARRLSHVNCLSHFNLRNDLCFFGILTYCALKIPYKYYVPCVCVSLNVVMPIVVHTYFDYHNGCLISTLNAIEIRLQTFSKRNRIALCASIVCIINQ